MEQIGESSQAGNDLPLALCLMGPTASGKTDLAMALARHLPVDVISVDSALIYRGMDIGTAKPTAEELAAVPHKLIDIVEPTESYSVARFYDDALAEMNQSFKNGRIPLLVGGTMMYFRVLRDGIAAMPSANQAIRAEINALAEQFGWPHIHELLAEVDPESAQRIKPTDPQRLQRALEVYKVSGKSLTQHWAEQSMSGQVKSVHTGKPEQGDYTESSQGIPPVPFKLLSFAISPLERKELHKRIAMRFHMMLEQGFQDEVERLMARGDLDPGMPSMRCVGYRQMWSYLAGELGYQEMIEKGIVATRQLAKRQLTWLRSWHELTWLETGDKNNLEKILNCFKLAASNNPDS